MSENQEAAPTEPSVESSKEAAPLSQAPDPTPAPQTWPENWRQELAGEDQAEIERLSRFQSPNDIYKSFRNMEAEFSKRSPRIEYDPEMPEEKLAEYRKQEGIPATPKDYNLEFESGLVIGEEEKPFVDSMLEYAHKQNVPESHVKSMLEWYYTDREAQNEAYDQKIADHRYQSQQQLKAEWGGEYTGNINAINELFVDNPELHDIIMRAVDSDGLPIGNRPDVIKWAASVGKQLNPTATFIPNEGDVSSIQGRISEIESWMHSSDIATREKYFKNESVQKEYEDLLAKQEVIDSRKK